MVRRMNKKKRRLVKLAEENHLLRKLVAAIKTASPEQLRTLPGKILFVPGPPSKAAATTLRKNTTPPVSKRKEAPSQPQGMQKLPWTTLLVSFINISVTETACHAAHRDHLVATMKLIAFQQLVSYDPITALIKALDDMAARRACHRRWIKCMAQTRVKLVKRYYVKLAEDLQCSHTEKKLEKSVSPKTSCPPPQLVRRQPLLTQTSRLFQTFRPPQTRRLLQAGPLLRIIIQTKAPSLVGGVTLMST